ncbi:MAG: hypothetical protein HW421_793 [Ignavibacteria bacterium]|nr:hypothetical protein [Ignavibacteria bacterium]
MKNTLLIIFLVVFSYTINAQTKQGSKDTTAGFTLMPYNPNTASRQQGKDNEAICEEDYPNETQTRWDRYEYDLMRLMDPKTGCLPENIRKKELEFASQMTYNNIYNAFKQTNGSQIQNVNWISRGPANIGGRTRALGIDVANENIILAGGTSGGMWRSVDRGASWQRTTPLFDLPSTTCLVQDKRVGKTNTWYYGTGELGGNTAAYPLWLNDGPYNWGAYYGNGIFKSTDNGITWNILKSTFTDSIGGLYQPFNIVNALAIDPSNNSQDVIYAAVAGGIERSSNGGATWSLVLGSFPPGALFTDVTVTKKGVVYAVLGTNPPKWGVKNSSDQGIFRSTDGIRWTNITPDGWPYSGSYYVSVAVAPSNENVVYVVLDSMSSANYWEVKWSNVLWKYSYLSGDGSGSGGFFEDRSANLILSGVSWVDYIKVKPDDENTVFVGGLYLVRSTDGFATQNKTTSMYSPHVDQNSMDFFPSKPESMVIGTDGGLYYTANNLAGNINWTNLNNNYITTQFYTVAIDHSTPGDMTIVGGMQDNFTCITTTTDATKPWKSVLGGDGAFCAIAKGKSSYFVSYQWGMTYRYILDYQGNRQASGRIDPIGGEKYLFINPFCLDPNNNDMMYLGGGNLIWRNDSLFILMNGTSPTSVGWTKLTNTTVSSISSKIINCRISFISSSKNPANRVYYGTSDGQLFRIDSANVGNPIPKSIWESKGLPPDSYVSSIAIDSENADNVLVAFANYNIMSLFYTSNGGTSWTSVSGNLEEFPDGSGNGPACRTVAILHSGEGIIYLVGTSIGLFSTSELNGMSTEWSLEGADKIGNNIVNMIDVRDSDGMVAVATCGHGVFSGNFEPATSVSSDTSLSMEVSILEQIQPNPFNSTTIIKLKLTQYSNVNLSIYDILGNKVAALVNEYLNPGIHEVEFDATNLQSGIYFCRINAGNHFESMQFVVIR